MCPNMVASYWGMPCGRESRVDCNSVLLVDDIKTKIIKCSSRSVLVNPGYGTIIILRSVLPKHSSK